MYDLLIKNIDVLSNDTTINHAAIAIQDGYIKFQRSPNGQIYAIDREVARIDCLETLME